VSLFFKTVFFYLIFFPIRNKQKVSENAKVMAEDNNFDVRSYKFEAIKEDLRKPKIVKIGAIQNSIALETYHSINAQREAIFGKIGKFIDAAAADGVNVLCLQELWSEFKF
jgi:beta-ureidopropionase